MAHPTSLDSPIRCAVITVSDTRTPETDHSGQAIQAFLQQANHRILDYRIVPDEPELLRSLCTDFGRNPDIDVVILSGGTGIAPRDTTYDVIERLLEKTLPGFGEIFRQLSFQQIGSRAIASRAVAGVYHHTLFFSLPGSSKAVPLAMEALILPELPHLVGLLRG